MRTNRDDDTSAKLDEDEEWTKSLVNFDLGIVIITVGVIIVGLDTSTRVGQFFLAGGGGGVDFGGVR